MSKTIYLLGAGASYGKRNKLKKIIEGVPVVSEIPKEFKNFRKFIANAEIPKGELRFQNIYRKDASIIELEKHEMLYDIDLLIKGIREHATIDTYARKLYLTGRKSDLKRLKELLCAFIMWTQLVYKADGRYDTFLANILEEERLLLPADISIISWNYDSQIETAYRSYNQNNSLPVFEKNLQGAWPSLTNCGRIFKINGTASFVDKDMLPYIQNDESNMSSALQIIEFYHDTQVDTSGLGVDYKTHISFAWEDSVNRENMMKSLTETLKDTEQVVVIGYSFPFFNREMDRFIFARMLNLQKIYIQDPNASAVSQSINAVVSPLRHLKIDLVSNCDQFCLPNEL